MTFLQSLKRMGPLGWIATLLALVFCIHIFLFFDSHSHSVSDMLYAIFPYWVPTFLLWAWLVEHLARSSKA